jgi:hypothetical protein
MIFLCTPPSNRSAERSFSVMRQLKNYLRSVVSENRLNSLAILSIESELTRAPDYTDVIASFAVQQSRQKLL